MEEDRDPTGIKNGQESQDSFFNARNIGLSVAGLALVIALTLGVVWILYRLLLPAQAVVATSQPPPEPRLQVDPAQDLQALRATEDARLHTYGWEDRSAAVVHIPIERAMELLASGQPPEAGQQGTLTPAEAGHRLFQDLGCSGCHEAPSGGIAPSLRGLFGSQVTLQSGETVTADEAYLRESIRNPTARVVQGFNPIMPNFDGRITDQDLEDLIAYLKSLAGP